MKKIALSFLLLATSLFAADMQLWKNSTLNKVLEKKELKVCMDPGYMPFAMKDRKGRVIGFDIDILRGMAKTMGVKLKIHSTAWDGIIAALLTDKCDMIASGMTITQERELKISFSDPYITVGQTLLLKKGLSINSPKELDKKGIKVTTKLGVTGDIVAKKYFKKAQVMTFEGEGEALSEVLNGNADAFIYDRPYNTLFMAQKGKGKVTHYDKTLSYEPVGFAIKKGDPDFKDFINNYLKQIKEDKIQNVYEKIYDKWFNNSAWLKRL